MHPLLSSAEIERKVFEGKRGKENRQGAESNLFPQTLFLLGRPRRSQLWLSKAKKIDWWVTMMNVLTATG